MDRRGFALIGVVAMLVGFCLAFNLGIFSGQVGGGLLFPLGRYWPLEVSCGLLAVIIALVVAIPRPSIRASVAAQPSRDPSHLHQQSTRSSASLSWVANLGNAFTISMVLHLFPHRGVIMHFFRFWRHRFVTSLVVQGVGIGGVVGGLLTLASLSDTTTSGNGGALPGCTKEPWA